MDNQIMARSDTFWKQMYEQSSENRKAAIARAREAEQEAREATAAYEKLKRRVIAAITALLGILNIALYALVLL